MYQMFQDKNGEESSQEGISFLKELENQQSTDNSRIFKQVQIEINKLQALFDELEDHFSKDLEMKAT